MKTIKVSDAQHHMLQVLVMFGHENEIPQQEGWNIQTYNNLFDEVMKLKEHTTIVLVQC